MVNMQNSPPALLCDEMLLGLGKWLRAAGYDTALPQSASADRLMVEQALAEQRLLLTRDTRMSSIQHADKVLVLLHGNDIPAWVGELALSPGIDWLLDPFSRCLLCNRPLSPGNADHAVPEWVAAQRMPTWHCPTCRRAYWHGGHVQRMLARLHTFAELSEQARANCVHDNHVRDNRGHAQDAAKNG